MSSAWFTELYREHCCADEWQRCEGCKELVRVKRLEATDDDVSLCPKCMKECEKDTEQHYLEHPEDRPHLGTNTQVGSE